MTAITVGELTTQHIGQTVQVKVSEHITVEDRLEAVGHGAKESVMVFETVTPDNMDPTSFGALLSAIHPKRGFLVDGSTPALVSDAEETPDDRD